MERAREVLTSCLREAGLAAVWTEWDTDDPKCPPDRQGHGSPTILVNGEDVAPGPHPWAPREEGAGPRCRVYRDGDEIMGVPPRERIDRAVMDALGPEVG